MKDGVAKGMFAVAELVLLLGTLLACMSSSELTAKGGDVEVTSSPPIDHGYPPGSCESKGYIVGHGGGYLGGWVSNDKLVEYAMNDLRNKASERGANYVEHDSPQMGVTGGESGTATTTATVSGTAYACDTSAKVATRGKPAAAPAAKGKASDVPRTTAVPEGAAGFKFGAGAAKAEERCTAAGFTWKRDGVRAGCSGTPSSVGAPGSTAVHLCGESVCGIDVLVAPAIGDLLTQYDDLYGRLRKKYGQPKREREPVSDACKNALEQCLASKPPTGARWKWPDGHKVELALASQGGTPLIQVIYRTPEGTAQDAPGPAL